MTATGDWLSKNEHIYTEEYHAPVEVSTETTCAQRKTALHEKRVATVHNVLCKGEQVYRFIQGGTKGGLQLFL